MRTNELPSLACLLYISFALLCFYFLAAHAASWPAAASGGAAEQLDCAIYNFAAIYQGDVCALYLLSHTHTHTNPGTLAHPLWPGTPCGKSWGGDRRVVLLYLIDRLCLASPRGTAIFPHSTGFSFGLENSLSKDFHQHVIAATWVKFATAAECMLVQVCPSLSRTAYATSRISIVLHPTPPTFRITLFLSDTH